MRDAFGGVFTMNFLLVFIFIFIAVSAISLNYAKAFKLKNSVIDFVEQNEIINPSDIGTKPDLLDKLNEIITNANYNKTCDSILLTEGVIKSRTGKITGYCHNGVVINIKDGYPQNIKGTGAKAIVYEITTYADWELGAFNKLLALTGTNGDAGLFGTWSVKGEARITVKP